MKPLPNITLKGARLPPPEEFDDRDSYLAFCREVRIRQERRQTMWTMLNVLGAIVLACAVSYGVVCALDALHRYLNPLS